MRFFPRPLLDLFGFGSLLHTVSSSASVTRPKPSSADFDAVAIFVANCSAERSKLSAQQAWAIVTSWKTMSHERAGSKSERRPAA